MQVFRGGLSSFTVVNMVAALLQHEAAAGGRRLPKLPPRPRQPNTGRMFADVRPGDLPPDLARLMHVDNGAAGRLGFAMVQSAASGWHLPAATLLEQHAHACKCPLPPLPVPTLSISKLRVLRAGVGTAAVGCGVADKASNCPRVARAACAAVAADVGQECLWHSLWPVGLSSGPCCALSAG